MSCYVFSTRKVENGWILLVGSPGKEYVFTSWASLIEFIGNLHD